MSVMICQGFSQKIFRAKICCLYSMIEGFVLVLMYGCMCK